MAVQLMPESAVCLLMVSLGGVQYSPHCLPVVFVSSFALPCLSLIPVSSWQNAMHPLKQDVSCHLIKRHLAWLLLPFTTIYQFEIFR